MWITLAVVAALLVGVNVFAAYELTSVSNNANPGPLLRPTGIPGNISTSLANLMQLSPVPGVRAPGFTFTDQRGHTMPLASLRGKVVVLEFMDPHCTDICPIVSQEFVDAYHELGAAFGQGRLRGDQREPVPRLGAEHGCLLRPASDVDDPELAFLHRSAGRP